MDSESKSNHRGAYTKLWRFMEGQRLRYGAAIAALIVGSCFMYCVPLVPQVVIDGVLGPESEQTKPIVRDVVAFFGGREYLGENLWLPALAMLLLTGIAGVFTYLRGRWSAMASQSICRRVRDELYDHLQHLPCSYHDKAETGDLVQRCSSDVDTLNSFLASQVVEVGRAAFMLLIPLPLMWALDPRMTLVSVATVPPIVIFSYIFFRKVRACFKKVDEAEGKMTATLQENLTGIRVVRAFARQEWEKEKFAARNQTHRGLHYRLYVLFGWYWSFSDLLCMVQKVLVVGLGGYWLYLGEIQAGTFYFFLAAVSMFIWPIRMMGRILADLGKAVVAIGRIGEILDEPREADPEVRRPSAARTLRPDLTRRSMGEIEFDRVRFAYEDKEDVLKGVSFRVEPGQTLALLGPSGSGKSTIASLLLRYYDPTSGAIRLGGQDLSGLSRKWVRSKVAAVMQEPFLYSKSIRENIRLGRSGADEPEITEAAVTACVHEAIEEFEDGYDTVVGERGVTLSGGQRQRVALARALLDDPPILILDDAFSAVDTETEVMIREALGRRHHRQTTLVIAHRISTLMSADRILVFDSGRIIQDGTHDQLVRQDGRYRRIYEIQSMAERELVACGT